MVDTLIEGFQIGDIVIQLGASVGLARAPDDTSETGSLLRAASIAMYRANQAGGRRPQAYHSSMEREICEREASRGELRQAINKGRIVRFYQPIVDLRNGRIVEFQNLARWLHPELGCLEPSRFIDLVVGPGQATPMLLSLIRQEALDAARWPGDIRFALNVFPEQLQEATLVDIMKEVAGEHALTASRLCLEISEEALVKDMACARTALMAAHRHGMSVALDDFGVGYYGLHHLRELPFNRSRLIGRFYRRSRRTIAASLLRRPSRRLAV